MAERDTNREMEDELRRLSLLPDDEIDTSDAPEVTDWSSARRAAFFHGAVAERSYDIRALANWFLDKLTRVGLSATNLSLNKILYFAIERSLIERSILLSPARIEAWDHGPVFREVYHAFKKGGDDHTIKSRIEKFSLSDRAMVVAREDLNEDDEAFLEDILQTYGRLSGSKLRELSHLPKGPWHSAWNRKGRVNLGMEISVRTILMTAPSTRQRYGRS